jgi:hypothetical protein
MKKLIVNVSVMASLLLFFCDDAKAQEEIKDE